jgi:rare lipoprotein A
MKKIIGLFLVCMLFFQWDVISQARPGARKKAKSTKTVKSKKSVSSKKKVKSKKPAKKRRYPRVQLGTASFYHNKFNGRRTASGEIFSQRKLTCAHNSLPLGTYVRVTNLKNKKSVILKVNDRLQKRSPRVLDLTKAGATRLGATGKGLLKVKVEVVAKRK